MRVAKVAQKQPMETVRCLKLEKHRLRSSDFSNAPGAYSLAHVLYKVVQVFLNGTLHFARLGVGHDRFAQHTFWSTASLENG